MKPVRRYLCLAALAMVLLAGQLAAQTQAPVVTGIQAVPDSTEIEIIWNNPFPEPIDYLGFAWDWYVGDWVVNQGANSVFFPFPPGSTVGRMDVWYAGAYFGYMSNWYGGTLWFPSVEGLPVINYYGPPHVPQDFRVVDNGDSTVQVQWRPDPFGFWHVQILSYDIINQQYTMLDTPAFPDSYWQYSFWGEPEFFAGDMTVGGLNGNPHFFYIRSVGWTPMDATTNMVSPNFASAFVNSDNVFADYVGRWRGPIRGEVEGSGLRGDADFTGDLRIDSWQRVPGTVTQYTAQGSISYVGRVVVEDSLFGTDIFNEEVDGINTFAHNSPQPGRIQIDAAQDQITFSYTGTFSDSGADLNLTLNVVIDETAVVGTVNAELELPSGEDVDGDGTVNLTRVE